VKNYPLLSYFPLLERGRQGDLEIHPRPPLLKEGAKGGDEGGFKEDIQKNPSQPSFNKGRSIFSPLINRLKLLTLCLRVGASSQNTPLF